MGESVLGKEGGIWFNIQRGKEEGGVGGDKVTWWCNVGDGNNQ